MNEIEQAFKKHKAFIGFIVGGDGGVEYSIRCGIELALSGVDILEIGLPFSDPVADGPVIQSAAERSLQGGTTASTLLEIARGIRKTVSTPLLLFSYYNPLLKRGDEYLLELKEAGFSGVLVVDLPPPITQGPHPFFEVLKRVGLTPIFLVSPSTDDRRLEEIVKMSEGFIYYACQKGTTGVRDKLPEETQRHIERIKKYTKLPIAIGFGIAERSSALEAISYADGFVVGSAFVKLMGERVDPKKLKSLVEKIDPRQK